jgi:hypothetical protein
MSIEFAEKPLDPVGQEVTSEFNASWKSALAEDSLGVVEANAEEPIELLFSFGADSFEQALHLSIRKCEDYGLPEPFSSLDVASRVVAWIKSEKKVHIHSARLIAIQEVVEPEIIEVMIGARTVRWCGTNIGSRTLDLHPQDFGVGGI